MKTAVPPSWLTCTSPLIAAVTFSPRSVSRPVTITEAPSAARVAAMAPPIPSVDPVTRAVRP
jgi:hypothetical protein